MSRNKNKTPAVDDNKTDKDSDQVETVQEKQGGYKVIKTFKGSPDGAKVFVYQEGDTVEHSELGAELTEVALDNEWIK